MNKLKLSGKNDDKKIITFTINKSVKETLKEILKNSKDYNLKMKSHWVNEAILKLKENPNYREMILNAEGNSKDFVFDKIYMTFDQRCIFAEIRNEVVKNFPDIKGPQAAIIRAAIVSRLIRKNNFW